MHASERQRITIEIMDFVEFEHGDNYICIKYTDSFLQMLKSTACKSVSSSNEYQKLLTSTTNWMKETVEFDSQTGLPIVKVDKLEELTFNVNNYRRLYLYDDVPQKDILRFICGDFTEKKSNVNFTECSNHNLNMENNSNTDQFTTPDKKKEVVVPSRPEKRKVEEVKVAVKLFDYSKQPDIGEALCCRIEEEVEEYLDDVDYEDVNEAISHYFLANPLIALDFLHTQGRALKIKHESVPVRSKV